MLMLPFQRIGEVLVADEPDDGAGPRRHVCGTRPQLAMSADGAPAFRLLRWAATAGEDRVIGARVHARAGLPLPDTLPPSLGDGEWHSMPWTAAEVTLEGPGFEPVSTSLAPAALSAMSLADAWASLAFDLDVEAAAVLTALLEESGLAPLQLTWSGTVRVRLPAVSVVASARREVVRQALRMLGRTASREQLRSAISASVAVQVVSQQTDDDRPPLQEDALRDWAVEELMRRYEQEDELTVRAETAHIVDWPLRFSTGLGDLPAGDGAGLIQRVLLDPQEFGQMPPLEVRVLGDFSGPLERVEVALEDMTGDPAAEVILSDGDSRRLRFDSNHYRWRRRVKFRDGPARPWSAWSETRSRLLLVPVSTPSIGRLEISASTLDFTRHWHSLEVSVMTADGVVDRLLLNQERSFATIEWPQDQPPQFADLRFVAANGVALSRQQPIAGDLLVITDPLTEGSRRLSLMPVGNGWVPGVQAMVDLDYGEDGKRWQETLPLSGIDDVPEWQAPRPPGGADTVRWRLHASLPDGRLVQTAWQTTEQRILPVPLSLPERRILRILPIHYEASLLQRLVVEVEHAEGRESLSIQGRNGHTLDLPTGPYHWQAHWHLVNGSVRHSDRVESDADAFVIPRMPP